MSMNVSLGKFEKFIQIQVQSGLYGSVNDVLCATLKLFIKKEQKEQKEQAQKMEKQEIIFYKKAIEDGINSGKSIPFNMDEIIKGGKKILFEKYGKKIN